MTGWVRDQAYIIGIIDFLAHHAGGRGHAFYSANLQQGILKRLIGIAIYCIGNRYRPIQYQRLTDVGSQFLVPHETNLLENDNRPDDEHNGSSKLADYQSFS